MRTRKTLEERLAKRNHRELVSLPPDVHVRAELNRLARQVRKLKRSKNAEVYAYRLALNSVLALLKEAGK